MILFIDLFCVIMSSLASLDASDTCLGLRMAVDPAISARFSSGPFMLLAKVFVLWRAPGLVATTGYSGSNSAPIAVLTSSMRRL